MISGCGDDKFGRRRKLKSVFGNSIAVWKD